MKPSFEKVKEGEIAIKWGRGIHQIERLKKALKESFPETEREVFGASNFYVMYEEDGKKMFKEVNVTHLPAFTPEEIVTGELTTCFDELVEELEIGKSPINEESINSIASRIGNGEISPEDAVGELFGSLLKAGLDSQAEEERGVNINMGVLLFENRLSASGDLTPQVMGAISDVKEQLGGKFEGRDPKEVSSEEMDEVIAQIDVIMTNHGLKDPINEETVIAELADALGLELAREGAPEDKAFYIIDDLGNRINLGDRHYWIAVDPIKSFEDMTMHKPNKLYSNNLTDCDVVEKGAQTPQQTHYGKFHYFKHKEDADNYMKALNLKDEPLKEDVKGDVVLSKDERIKSVQRGVDGEIFAIGDEVSVHYQKTSEEMSSVHGTIEGIYRGTSENPFVIHIKVGENKIHVTTPSIIEHKKKAKAYLLTEDGISVRIGDLVWAVDVDDSIENLTEDDYIKVTQNIILKADAKETDCIKFFNNKESAREYIQERDWKEGDLYFVQFSEGEHWRLRYSSPKFGHFFDGQRIEGDLSIWHKFVKCPEELELPK